jgi:hypothetical protein
VRFYLSIGVSSKIFIHRDIPWEFTIGSPKRGTLKQKHKLKFRSMVF